ncbi:MAG: DNA translocase FtsK 4TM domain-containing protein, partial [Campylobacterales bacterium]|nr:DNA translocase FtsK 4TM domain-containing protein [Campylobacterales bacterium]
MKITMIISAILLIYGAFSTIFHETSMVGKIGKIVGDTNIFLFGFMAYINLIILIYPLIAMYKNRYLIKRIDFFIGWILIFVGLVIFSGLIFSPQNAGFLAHSFVTFLEPYIGQAGIWLFWLMTMMLSAILLLDDDFRWESLFDKVKKNKNETSYSYQSDDTFKVDFTQRLGGISKGFSKMYGFIRNPFDNSDKTEYSSADDQNPYTAPIKPITTTPKTPNRNSSKAAIVTNRIEPLAEIRPAGESKNLSDFKKQTISHSSNVEIISELEENSKLLAQIDKGAAPQPKNFKLPRLDFLQKAPRIAKRINEEEIDRKIKELLDKLKKFNIEGD